MIDLIPIATGTVGIIIGFGTCAFFTASAVKDAIDKADRAGEVCEQLMSELSTAEASRLEAVRSLEIANTINLEHHNSNERIMSVNKALWQRIGNSAPAADLLRIRIKTPAGCRCYQPLPAWLSLILPPIIKQPVCCLFRRGMQPINLIGGSWVISSI